MGAKKKLIARMAFWTSIVLVVAVVASVVLLLVGREHRQRWADRQKIGENERIAEARAYLAELATRIDRLPVDGTLASEIESKHFEELPEGRQYVWATDTTGDFVFGVPRPAFDKLNAIYDREVTPRLKEGVFVDRQSFLMAFIDDHDAIHLHATPGGGVNLVERGEAWRLDRWEPDGAVVLSAPLKTPAGSALGSLYLKRMPSQRHGFSHDERVEAALATAGITAFACAAFLWLLLPTWVYVDARARGVRRAPLFAFLTVLSSVIGLIVYLIARPEDERALTCPGCAREVDGGAFCPHCGRDLSRSICPSCRYPLKPDWAYCPACRTELRSVAPGAPLPEAG